MCAKGNMYDIEDKSHDQSCDSTVANQDLAEMVNSTNQAATTQEVVIRPKVPVVRGSRLSSSREVDHRKSGDFEKQQMIETRMKQLGLFESKKLFESALIEKLKSDIDRDALFKAINTCKRRRPIRDRMSSVTDEIINVIQPKIVKDSYGNKLSYKVNIMMGVYTHNVLHTASNHEVFIQGTTPERYGDAKLVKEIRIQFPKNVDMSGLKASFNAGVFKCEAPFRSKQGQLRSRSLSSLSSYSGDSSFSSSDQYKSHDIPSIEGSY